MGDFYINPYLMTNAPVAAMWTSTAVPRASASVAGVQFKFSRPIPSQITDGKKRVMVHSTHISKFQHCIIWTGRKAILQMRDYTQQLTWFLSTRFLGDVFSLINFQEKIQLIFDVGADILFTVFVHFH